jgi:hypothetical protein
LLFTQSRFFGAALIVPYLLELVNLLLSSLRVFVKLILLQLLNKLRLRRTATTVFWWGIVFNFNIKLAVIFGILVNLVYSFTSIFFIWKLKLVFFKFRHRTFSLFTFNSAWISHYGFNAIIVDNSEFTAMDY